MLVIKVNRTHLIIKSVQWWRHRVSLNVYLFLSDIQFNFFFSLTRYSISFNYLWAPLALNKIFLSGPEQRNHGLWRFERKVVFFSGGYITMWNCQWNKSYNKCIKSTKHDIYLILEANMTDWLIHWNIFPFLWWRTSLQMSRSECKINQKLSVRSIPGKIKYFVLFLVYFEGKHRNNCECYPCLFLSVSHLLSMLQLESLSH